jgi:hypothetical protein
VRTDRTDLILYVTTVVVFAAVVAAVIAGIRWHVFR